MFAVQSILLGMAVLVSAFLSGWYGYPDYVFVRIEVKVQVYFDGMNSAIIIYHLQYMCPNITISIRDQLLPMQ